MTTTTKEAARLREQPKAAKVNLLLQCTTLDRKAQGREYITPAGRTMRVWCEGEDIYMIYADHPAPFLCEILAGPFSSRREAQMRLDITANINEWIEIAPSERVEE